MMNFYISTNDVCRSIDYFKTADFDTDEMLFLFLLSKHFGISTSYPITYSTSNLSSTQKSECLQLTWMLAGMFDSTESCGKRGLMFPTFFKESSKNAAFYQPGSEFSGIVGRIQDTIKQKAVKVPVYDLKNFPYLSLKSNYKELIQENYLKGGRISLSNIAAWVFRFTVFDFATEPSAKQFSRVIEKAVRKLFKINKGDFLWLFDDDLSQGRLTPADKGITGEELRAQFIFPGDKNPEVSFALQDEIVQKSALDRDVIERYLALNGDNPSDDDILDILLNKKQIVLTGVPGVGKSMYTQMLCTKTSSSDPGKRYFSKTQMVQFHASYAYEDFIGAETLKAESGVSGVVTRMGTFLQFVVDAQDHPDENYLFIIDELNRGNIAEIFGETILALDRGYSVKLTREYYCEGHFGKPIAELKLPDNLYIVATMNTSDRNIAFLDLAIRRRFAFVSLFPNYDFLSEEVKLEDIDLGNVLRIINQRIVNTLKDSELILGQSYFIPKMTDDAYIWDFSGFKNQFNFVLLPTIREYSFNDPSAINTIVGEALGDGIQETDEFKMAFIAEFSS